MFFVWFGVIEVEQVQQFVGGEQDQFIYQGVVGGLSLCFGDLGVQYDVVEQFGGCWLVFGVGVQFVYWEVQYVGWIGFVYLLYVQCFYGVFVDEDDCDFGVWVDVQLCEVEVCEVLQYCFVDVDG